MNSPLDVKDLAQRFWKQGFLHIPNFFSVALAERYNHKIIDHFGMQPNFEHADDFIKKSGAEVVPWFPQRDGELCFNEVSQDPKLIALTEEILGQGWYEQYSMVMFSKQGTAGQAWHQDCLCQDPNKFNLNRLMYTMDISAHTTGGQTTVVPGSHLTGMIPSVNESLDERQAISISPAKGDLLLLHGHCYHKVEKVTGPYRVSTNYRAASKNTPEDITDIGVYRNMLYQFSTSTVIRER
jgi:ectoine hydroxylase-related dioxygenase (phytanoyl-CoA dioxygenase family)